MEDVLMDKMSLTTKQYNITADPMFTPFNMIGKYIRFNTFSEDIRNLLKYTELYEALHRDRSFQIIDLQDGLRLFVYVPNDLNLVELSSIFSSMTESCRRSRMVCTHEEINNMRNRFQRVKVFYPFNSSELEEIITYLDRTSLISANKTPIVIAQIKYIFPTYDYNGIDLENNLDSEQNMMSIYNSFIKKTPLILNRIYQRSTTDFTSEYSRKISNNNHEHFNAYDKVILDAAKVFDFIKDSGLTAINNIDIQLSNVMTIIAPQLASIYDRLDLCPTLKFKLEDPVCYPYSFHRIYQSIMNANANANANDNTDEKTYQHIQRIVSTPAMMNVLNGLSLMDLYVRAEHEDINIHPIYSERVRIDFSPDSELYIDRQRLIRILRIKSKVHIGSRKVDI
jgi:hypothetical protein